jgi:hypothetical protein
MTKRLFFLAVDLIGSNLFATPQVLFLCNDTTGIVQQTGQFVAGSTHEVTFRLTDGAWSDTGVYSITIKPDGMYDSAPFVLIAGASFTVAAADLEVSVNLNLSELYTYLGKADARSVMFELADASSAYVVRHRIVINNSVRRPGDTAPANPATNTYTDAEIDARINAIPAGVTPVASPIDGWTVQCTSAGQIAIGPIPAVYMVQMITEYPDATTLSTQDYLLLWDASESALRKVSLATLLTSINAQ